MADELSDADVMQPLPAGQPQALSDDEVMVPPKREGGLLQAIPELFHTVPKAAELMSTPQGRAALVHGLQQFGEGVLDLFKSPGKAVSEGLTPEEETEFSVNIALAGIPKAPIGKGLKDLAKAFEQTVMRPAIDRLTPQIPEAVTPIAGSEVPRTVPRSELAATGESHVDAVLNSEVIKSVIDQPLIDRSHSVPYTAGGSVPLDDPTVFIDWRFPHLMEVDGKVFDPAEPFTIHENVEQLTMDLLTKGGEQKTFKYDPLEMARSGELTADRASTIADEYRQKSANVENEVLGDDAEAWRKAHKLSDRYWDAAEDEKAKAQDKIVSEIEAKHPQSEVGRLYGIIGDEGHTDPEGWRQLARDLSDVEGSRDDAVSTVAYTLRRLPDPSKPLADIDRETLAVIQHALNEEGKRGGSPEVFLRDAFRRSGELYGGGHDAAEIIASDIERLRELLKNPPLALPSGRMSNEAAYRVAHFEFAEKAEGAWYKAHGIDKERAEAAYAPIMAEIQRGQPETIGNAAVRLIDGRVFTGKNHSDAIDAAIRANGGGVEFARGGQGLFETSSGRIITAKEAVDLEDSNIPSNLYKRPYPHDQPSAARHEAIAEARPSEAEIAQAKERIRQAIERGELRPGMEGGLPVLNPGMPGRPPVDVLAGLRQAREFGIIGPDKTPVATDSPARAAQRAIPAARQDDKITMTPAGEPVDAWQARFKDWVSRVKEPEDVKPFIERAAQENNNFPEARAGEISPAHVEIVAKAAGVNPSKIDIAELSNKFNNPDKVRMIKQALDQTLQDYKAAKSIVEDNPSIENTGKMLEAEMRRDYMVEYAIGLRAEWGRTGHALRDLLDAAKGATEEGKPNREQIINDLLAGKARTPSDMADIARATRGLSDEELARTLTNMRGKGPHWLHWAVSQGLISGVVTHTLYIPTNLMFMELERVIAPSVAAIFDRLRGNPDPILWGEIGAAQRAIVNRIPDAWQSSKQAFLTGLRVPLPHELRLLADEARGPKSAAKVMAPYVSGQPVNWGIFRRIASDETLAKVEYHLGLPGRSANFQHTFFKNLSFHASTDAQAYRAAAKEVADTKSQAFSDRMDFWRANPTDAMSRAAIDDGYSGTFMEKLGAMTAEFSRRVRDTPFQWVFFFTHIPMNIARAGVRYTAPYLGKEMRADMLGENGMSKQNLAYAKWTLGASFASYFVYKGLMGDATGSYPVDPKERQRWKDQNIQPNSIKAFGQWWSLERLGPPGIAAKIGADIGYIARTWDHKDKTLGENVTNAMGHLVLAFANAYSTEAGFQSMANLMDLVQGKRTPSEWAAYQGASFAQPISFLSQAASFMDPHAREAKTLIDGVKMRLPFLREALPAKLDPLYGEPRPNPGYMTFERHVPVMADPVKQELDRLDYHPTAPAPHISGVRLTPEQYIRYQATAGPLVKEALTALVQQPVWPELPAEKRKESLQKTIAHMRAYAAMSMKIDQPELIESARQARLKRIGIKE